MKKKSIIIGLVLLILVLCIGLWGFNERFNELNNEYELLQAMKIDEEDLETLYTVETIDSKWIEEYRAIGLRFLNYVCEYGGDKSEVEHLIKLYSAYGEKILLISDKIENYELSLAKTELDELKIVAKNVTDELERLYGKYN